MDGGGLVCLEGADPASPAGKTGAADLTLTFTTLSGRGAGGEVRGRW